MHVMQKILMVLGVILLSACASTPTPSFLQLSGMKMSFNRPVRSITAQAISRDGSRFITVDNAEELGNTTKPAGGALHLWDLTQGRQLRTISLQDLLHISTVAISPDGKYAVIGGRSSANQSSVGLWDLDRGELVRSFPSLQKEVFCVAFSPDGQSFLATQDTNVFLFNTESAEVLRQINVAPQASILPLPKHLVAAFTPDGFYIITGGADSVLKMWDIESGLKVQHFAGHEKGFKGGITGIAVSSDSQFIFTSAAGDDSARKWDIATGKLLQIVSGTDGISPGTGGTALSPDDKFAFIASEHPALWDLTTGKKSTSFSLDKSTSADSSQRTPAAALFHPNGKSLFLPTGDGAIRLFDTTTGREQAMLISFDEEWIIITAEGYYNASKKGADYLTANIDGKNFPIERFYDAFYRPDIVMAALQGEDVRNIAPLTMALAVKAPPPTAGFATLPTNTDQDTIKVCYQVSSTGGGIGEIRLFHNGKLIVSDGYYRDMVRTPAEKIQLMAMDGAAIHEQMRSMAISEMSKPVVISSHEKGASFTDCKEIDTVAGDNEITITAFNKGNTMQSPAQTMHFRSTKTPPAPHLYILSIGAKKFKEKAVNLKFAAKDATDILQKLKNRATTLFPKGNIHQELLVDENANKANIFKKINTMSSIIRPEDSFILFIASHGVLLQNQSYMLTSDYDGMLNDADTISSNEFVDIAKKIKSLNQFFIFDSCQAGGIDAIVNNLYEARIFVLAKKMGVPLFASTTSVQSALDGYKGNGLFAHSLIEGLDNPQEADTNNDQTISISEFGTFAQQATIRLSKKLGYQQKPSMIDNGKDTPLYKMQ